MVLRNWLIQRLDVKWSSSVDPRERFVPFILRRRTAPDDLPFCVAGSGKTIVWLVIFLLLSHHTTHVDHKFGNHTTHHDSTRRRKGHVSVFLLRFSGRREAKCPQPCRLSPSPTFGILEAMLRYHLPSLFGTREGHTAAQQWYIDGLFMGHADGHCRTPNFHHHGCTR